MDFVRLTLLFIPLACTDRVSVLETVPDAGFPMDATSADVPATDTGSSDGGAIDLGVVEDTGVGDSGGFPCESTLASSNIVSLPYDSARSAPRTEARGDQFAVMREADITVYDSYTPELHQFSLYSELISMTAHLDISGSFGILNFFRMDADYGAVVIREHYNDFAFKPNLVADEEALIIDTGTTAVRGAAIIVADRLYYTTHDPDETNHVMHMRGIHDPVANDRVMQETVGFTAYDTKLYTAHGEIWFAYVQDWDFPRALFLQPLTDNGEMGGPNHWTGGCGVESYDVVFPDLGRIAMVADCFEHTLIAVYDRFNMDLIGATTVHEGNVRVGSAIAWDQQSFGVVYWPEGEEVPRIRFFDEEAKPRSESIMLPAPDDTRGEAIGIDTSAARPLTEGARWIAAYTYVHEPGERGTVYVSRFDGCD